MTPPLPLEEAQARLLALAGPLPVERVDVASALGRSLAEPLKARRTQPAAHASAMDGYAVRADDLAGPWTVIGESAAGHPFNGPVGPGEAVRISTGALLPEGAGAVVVQEDIAREGDRIVLTGEGPGTPGKHVRLCGSDFCLDCELLPAGTTIGPAQIALALAAGHNHLAVHRRPRVVIIDSGDELAADPENCPPHQVPASNGAMLAAMLAALPVHVERIGPVADDLDALAKALAKTDRADLIVTSGGASVGDHDLIRPALETWGASLDFWRVAIKPGKPLLVATKGSQIVLGLPGNPVSSHVTAQLFLLPLVRKLLGASDPLPRFMPMRLAASAPAVGSRREFVRARFVGGGLEVLTQQDSGALGALARAEALIDRPANSPALPQGTEVAALLIAGA